MTAASANSRRTTPTIRRWARRRCPGGVESGSVGDNFNTVRQWSEVFSPVGSRDPRPRPRTDEGVIMIARRQVLAAGAAGSAALALSACGGDDGGGEVDGEGKTITMWLMEGTNANTSEYVTALSEAFTEQTGATLDVQVQPSDGAPAP